MVVCCEERALKKQYTTQSNAMPPQMTADSDHTTQMQQSVGGMSAEREEGRGEKESRHTLRVGCY